MSSSARQRLARALIFIAPALFAANGQLTIIGSVAHKGAKKFATYAATKAALRGFSRSLREEWKGRASVQILHPGAVRTGMHAKAGLKAGLSISAVNGKAYSAEALRLAVEENRDKPGPIEIFAKYDDQYSNFLVDYSGGLRYPHLQKIPGQDDRTEGGIDRLLKPKTR